MFERLTIGAWAITAEGCPVRVVLDGKEKLATLILGDRHREFEICLDTATLTEVAVQSAHALHALRVPRPTDNHEHDIEAVVVRDPDGATEVRVFVDGIETATTQLTVDAGAGWTWEEWTRTRDNNLAAATPAARQLLLEAYANPPGSVHIRGRNESAWL
ncbi:hypothetical protein ACIP5Y_04155 [Nocardia sp. NPDC088792]|uniref:hypothetical protein n=1 Tax=Nocardia sp. NPDC088792 TaxID=3364332 RepID=UPI0037FD8BD9